jgi:hypothetical protein
MRSVVDLPALREMLTKQMGVVSFNRVEYDKRLNSDCPYVELADWRGRLYRSESEADRVDTLIREGEWGSRMPPHP